MFSMAGLQARHPEMQLPVFAALDGRVKPAHGEEMKYSSRFWLYAPTGLFLALAVGVMIHWWIAAGIFEKKLAALNHHQAIPGVTLEWTSVAVGGFPFRLDADFAGFRVHGAGAHGGFAWSTPQFALHSLTYGRPKVIFEVAGPQDLRWSDARGREHHIAFLPASLRASALTDARGLSRFDLDVYDAGSPAFTVGRFQIHLRRDPDARDLDLMLRADSLKGFGLEARLVQTYVALNRADLLAPLLAGTASWPEAVRSWRAHGGTARFSRPRGISPDALLSALY
jgi:hypothetical protein